MNWREIKNGLALGAGALLAIALVIGVFRLTSGTIQETQQQQLTATLSTLLADNSYNNAPATDVIYMIDAALGGTEPKPVYRARLNTEPAGVVISATATEGYNGDIEFLVGLNLDGKINAVRVLNHGMKCNLATGR